MESVTEEHAAAIMKRCDDKHRELELVERISTDDMWLQDLEHLEKMYGEYIVERNAACASIADGDTTTTKKTRAKTSGAKRVIKTKK